VPDYEVRIGGPGDADKLRADLADMGPALRFIGSVTVAQAHQAFRDQKLGDVKWPVRYPKQRSPFINIAPVVFKAGKGQIPGPDDFLQSPALEGTHGDLYRYTGWKLVGKDAVEIGHPEAWSGRFQWGGIGRIPITDTTRATLGKWLKTKSGKPSQAAVKFTKRDGVTKEVVGSTSYGKRSDYASKLAFVFDPKRTELVQLAYPRPWLGMTPKLYEEIDLAIARHLGARVPGSSAPLPPLPRSA